MGVVLFMVISFVGISSSYARSENHINTPSVVVFGAPDANISAGNLSPMSTTHPPGGGGGGGGGGNPYPPVYYTIEIFGGNGEAEVSGDILSNGQTIMLIASTTYAIQAVSLASSYGFFQWETNSGSINNYESPSTSLNTGYSNGILTLVLNASANPWSGNSVSFTPNTQSAEWILENQVEGNQFGGNHYSLPDFGTVSWTDVSSNIGNLLYPVSALYFSVATNANYGYAYGGESFPGYLTSPGSFDVTYSPP